MIPKTTEGKYPTNSVQPITDSGGRLMCMREELEFHWPGRQPCRGLSTSQQRRNRRRWWLEQMRYAVDSTPAEPYYSQRFNSATALRDASLSIVP